MANGQEVVAVKSKSTLYGLIYSALCTLAIWAVVIALIVTNGAFVPDSDRRSAAIVIIVSLAVLTVGECVFCIKYISGWLRLSQNLIVRSGEELCVCGGTVKISHIARVYYSAGNGRRASGTVTLVMCDGRNVAVNHVSDARAVCEKLNLIISQNQISGHAAAQNFSDREALATKLGGWWANVMLGCAIAFIVLTLVLILGLVASCITFEGANAESIAPIVAFSILTVGCTVITAFCLRARIKYNALPQEMITKEGDKISCLGDGFKVGDIKEVSYTGYPQNAFVKMGTLTILLTNGKKFKLNYLNEPWEVHSKLLKIMAEYMSRKL